MKKLFIGLENTCYNVESNTLDDLFDGNYKINNYDNVIQGLEMFSKENPNVEIHVLSKTLPADLRRKELWVDENLPFIKRKILIPYVIDKSEYLSDLYGDLKNVYLLDDYEPTLHSNSRNGGNSIKLSDNYTDMEHWHGYVVNKNLPPLLICEELKKYMNIKKGEC